MAKRRTARRRARTTVARETNMKKNGFLDVVMWIVGILVSLAVGFGMTSNILAIPFIPVIVTQVAGWIVVVGTIIGVVMAIVNKA